MRTEWLQLSGWADRRGQRRGIVLLIITIAIFIILFRRIDLRVVGETLGSIDARTWGAALLLTLTFPIFSALRWRLTLRSLGHKVSFWRCFTIILGVSPISAIAPSKAGDLLKAISFRGEISILEVGGTVLAERAFDVIVLAVLAVAGSLAVGNSFVLRLNALIAGAGIIGLLLLPILVALVPKQSLREKLERTVKVLHALRTRPRLALGVTALTAINWLASIVQTHLLLAAVGAATPFWLTTAVLPTAIFVGLIPITLGGMGTRDAALVALLASTATAAQALSVGLLYSFFGYWLLALLGLPFLKTALFKQPRTSVPPTPDIH